MTMHRVQDGEKLSEIAQAYGISTDQIVAANPAKEAVTLVSGEQVFASLAAGEDIELPPGVLGAAESDYPRRFYEQAFDALLDTLSLDLKSQDALDKVAQAAAYMKSAVTYLETHPLMSSKYRDQQDAVVYAKGLLTSIDTLDNILRGTAFQGANYYVLLADTLKRLGAEMDKWPKPSAASVGALNLVFKGNPFDKPAPGAFPTGSSPQAGTPTGSFPTGTPKYGTGAGSPTTDDAEAACAAKGTRLNRTTGMCVANDGTTSRPFPDVTWGGPANVKLPSDTDAPAATAASCAAKGLVFDVTTKACVPMASAGGGTSAGAGGQQPTQPTGTAPVSTTKKVLIVAGSVVALGLAGWGAWHVLAKDKAEKKPTP